MGEKRIHDIQKTFQCDTCSATFVDNNSLISHKKDHIVARPLNCYFCSSAFRVSAFLKIHETSHMLEQTNLRPQFFSILSFCKDII